MQQCHRCGGTLKSTDSRGVIDTKVYHLYCWYKITEKEKERENQLPKGSSGDTNLLDNISKSGTRNPKGSA